MHLPALAQRRLRFGLGSAWAVLFATLAAFDIREGFLVIAGGGLALAMPKEVARSFDGIRRFLARLSEHRTGCIVGIGLAIVLLRVALLPILPIPIPVVHDEFSYLFAADTFASGRLTNPAHPMWVHFETFHVSRQPTAFSKYFPAQGLTLAVGQTLLGHPWYGVLLCVGLMSSALLWMLQQWLPARWALFGASILAVRLGLTSYWVNSYWGGAVAATGGALVWGALPGVLAGRKARYSVIFGLGLVILANSRPLEGAMVSLPAVLVLSLRFLEVERSGRLRWLSRSVAPTAILLGAGAGSMLLYNQRLTGDAFLVPHRAYDRQYATTDDFYGTAIQEAPGYNHEPLREFWAVYKPDVHRSSQTLVGFFALRLTSFYTSALFFVGSLFMVSMASLPSVLQDRRVRLLWIALAFFFLCLNIELDPRPHYLAPGLPLICALGVQCTRHLTHWKDQGKPTGRALVVMTAIIPFIVVVSCLAHEISRSPEPYHYLMHDRCVTNYGDHPMADRQRIQEDLLKRGGRHLVIVHYDPEHDFDREWVFNRADIDNSAVVWAHDMGAERNRALLDYFRDRRVWLVKPDETETRLIAHQR